MSNMFYSEKMREIEKPKIKQMDMAVVRLSSYKNCGHGREREQGK
jgi:LEA14-like dessication related protein